MAKKHDESNDVGILIRIGRVKVDKERKILRMSKGTDVGIRTWGRIDFLTHHRGWTVLSFFCDSFGYFSFSLIIKE